jgi:hypothetical protein
MGSMGTRAAMASIFLAGCASTDTIVADEPRAATAFAIAPYEFHEECATVAPGDRLDYQFEAQAPVNFQIYYKEGIAFISTVSRDDVRDGAGIFNVPAARRYCVRWDAGQQGALVDFRIRLMRAPGK